jgi:hypothetical protein
VWKTHRSPKWLFPRSNDRLQHVAYGLWHHSKRVLQQRARLLLVSECRVGTDMPMMVADVGGDTQRAADDRHFGSEDSENVFAIVVRIAAVIAAEWA